MHTSQKGNSAMHLACYLGDWTSIKLLLVHKGNLEFKNVSQLILFSPYNRANN